MAFKPGQSGNPNGRPPKEQSLSHILSVVSEETSNLTSGSPKKFTYNVILAHYIWQAAIFGEFKFRDGRKVVFEDASDWLKLVKWIYTRIDGTPRQAVDVTSGDEPLQANTGMVIILPSNGREIEDEDNPSEGATG